MSVATRGDGDPVSNGRRHRRQHHRERVDPLAQYHRALVATGMPEREVARAVLYADQFGLDALTGDGCVVFAEPTCGDWNCLNPTHQAFETH